MVLPAVMATSFFNLAEVAADDFAGMDRRPRAQGTLDGDALVELAANRHQSDETGIIAWAIAVAVNHG